MDRITKCGQILTDEEINQLGEAADRGDFVGTPGEWIVRPPGRPNLGEKRDLVSVTFKAPRAWVESLEGRAKDRKVSKSQLIRTQLGI